MRKSLEFIATLIVWMFVFPVSRAFAQGNTPEPVITLEELGQILTLLTIVITYAIKKWFSTSGIQTQVVNLVLNVAGKGLYLYFTGVYGPLGTTRSIITAILAVFAAWQVETKGYELMQYSQKRAVEKAADDPRNNVPNEQTIETAIHQVRRS